MKRGALRRRPSPGLVVALAALTGRLLAAALMDEAETSNAFASAIAFDAAFWLPHDAVGVPGERRPGVARDASAWVRRRQLGDGPAGRGGLVHRFKRPTDGTGYYNNGYGEGVAVHSYESPGGCCKVWYVADGKDAVRLDDADASGVPDFVERVASSMDVSYARYVEMGFKPPLNDETYHDRPDYGGDGRIDCYLMNLVSSDGYVVIETLPENTLARDASGYMVMENDFAEYHYPNIEFAIDVLTSHELFHMFQNAYDYDQPLWWSEGTAEWSTEQAFPDLNEWLHFAPAYMSAPEQSLHAASLVATSRPYGAVLWPLFLSERFGPEAVRAVWEALEHGEEAAPGAVLATKQVLDAWPGASFEAAFAEFGWWLFRSGARASAGGEGYADAEWLPPLRQAASISALETPVSPFEIEALGLAYVALPIVGELSGEERLSLRVSAGSLDDLRCFHFSGTGADWSRTEAFPVNGEIGIAGDAETSFLMIANTGLIRTQRVGLEAFVAAAVSDHDEDAAEGREGHEADLDEITAREGEPDATRGDEEVMAGPPTQNGFGSDGGCRHANASNLAEWIILLALLALCINRATTRIRKDGPFVPRQNGRPQDDGWRELANKLPRAT